METTRHIIELRSRYPDGFTIDQAREAIGDEYQPIMEVLVVAGVVVEDGSLFRLTEYADDIADYDGSI